MPPRKGSPSPSSAITAEPTPPPALTPNSHENFGILQFNSSNWQTVPSFTEEETVMALRRLGVVPEELVELSKAEKSKIPGTNKARLAIIDEIEKRRLQTIKLVTETREQIVEEKQRKTQVQRTFKFKARAESPKDLEASTNRQKKQIENMIVSELAKREILENEIKRKERLDAYEKEKAEKLLNEKRIIEQKKLEADKKVQERLKTREEELLEKQKKQDEDRARWMMEEEEKQKKKLAEIAKNEKEREKKLNDLRLEKEKKELDAQNERARLEEEQRIKEEERLQAKSKELEQMKKDHAAMMERQQAKIEKAKQKEKEKLLLDFQKMEENEKKLNERLAEVKKQQADNAYKQKLKNEEKMRKSAQALTLIEENDRKKREELEKKRLADLERIQKLQKERDDRIKNAVDGNDEKTKQAKERKLKKEQMDEENMRKSISKMQKVEERIQVMSQNKEEEVENKAAMQWLKIKTGETNAKRLERRNEFMREDRLQKIREKEEQIQQFNEAKAAAALKTQRRAAQLQNQKTDLINEFDESVKTGGLPDLEKIAGKFGVDVETVKQRVYKKKEKRSALTD